MTCVVVNDASCLIDLGKGGLLPFLCSLPYRFIVPLPIRTSETLSLSDQDWHGLDSAGMVTHDLTPAEVEAAFGIKGNNPALSANDCFCFVTAQVNDGILLTGDAQLAQAARRNGLSVHGVLWVIDQLKQEKVCEYAILAKALITWRQDSSVFLPKDEILGRLSLFVPQDDLSRTSDFGPCNVRDAIPAEYSKGKLPPVLGIFTSALTPNPKSL